VCEVVSLVPFRVLGPTRVVATCHHAATLPSCSSRALQSVSRLRSIAVWVDDPSLALALASLTFEVFLRCPGGKKPLSLFPHPLVDFVLLQGIPEPDRLFRGTLSWGFVPLQRMKQREATYAGLA
jgi:hypothetical protein